MRYEINGQRYSYDTENREQAALARERIRAANAEAAARAKAEAERGANPLVRLFGSTTQAQAKAAEGQLKEVLAKRPVDSAKVRKQPVAPARPATNTLVEKTTGAKDAKALVAENGTKARIREDAGVRSQAGPTSNDIETITFDFVSGIRTVKRADGSIEEDLFDASSAVAVKVEGSGAHAGPILKEATQEPAKAKSYVATEQP